MGDSIETVRRALADRYRVERKLGAGGTAIVYLAQDLRHQRPVAIKVLRAELAAALGVERFLREIRTAATLTHPHLVSLLDSGVVESGTGVPSPWYAMPFVDGESLRDRLTREGQLPVEDAVRIARELADALGHAHRRGLIHRDIKPENVLLEGGHALLADFGIARAIGESAGERITASGTALGTPGYMSPEQAAGEDTLDGRSDQYSLGVLLYEMLLGEPPFGGPSAHVIVAKQLRLPPPSLRLLRPSVPLLLEQAIIRALKRRPADRFPTIEEFAGAVALTLVGGVS